MAPFFMKLYFQHSEDSKRTPLLQRTFPSKYNKIAGNCLLIFIDDKMNRTSIPPLNITFLLVS